MFPSRNTIPQSHLKDPAWNRTSGPRTRRPRRHHNLISMMSGTPFRVTGTCDASRQGNSPTMVDIVGGDERVARDFAATERFHIQFRAEAFNFTNIPRFAAPDNSLGDANAVDPKTGRGTDPGAF